MKKVYTGELLSNIRIVPLLYANFNVQKGRVGLFSKEVLQSLKNEKIVEVVDDPENADYILIPHNYRKYKNNESYIQNFICLSQRYGKKILVFAGGDLEVEVSIPNCVVFRNSRYRSTLQRNDIIMPTYAEDLGGLYGVDLRNKVGDRKPVVGFCGWAGFSTTKQIIKTHIKDVIVFVKGVWLGQKNIAAHKNGVFIRKRVLGILGKTPQVITNFIIRTSFSSNKNTIELDPEIARREYIDTLKESDLGLAVRGDGNYSIRFYEILSLGRIPLYIDTDAPLPLESYINYKDFVVYVPVKDIKNIGIYIEDFWKDLTNEEFILMQKKARDAFVTYLKFDRFLRFSLDNLEEILESNKNKK